MLETKLCQIGFSDSESLVYLELLKLGPQPVSVVAKRAGLNRSSTYAVLRSLESKGVVSSFKSGNISCFSANDPNSIIGYLDRKCRVFDYQRSQMLAAIPEFRSVVRNYEFDSPQVRFLEGIEGVKQVLFEGLNAENLFRTYFSMNMLSELGVRDFMMNFKERCIERRNVEMRVIVPNSAEARDFFGNNFGKHCDLAQILYVEECVSDHIFGNEMNIYDDKVAILYLEKGAEYAVVIESREIAAMHKAIFDMAWKGFGG